MYGTRDYGSMIADRVRMDAYTKALREAVKPGDVVVDLGTGTGIFAMLACQLGAARVIAIEPNENILVAKRIARDNGLFSRIEFLQDISENISLDEKADVIISDLRGLLPMYEKHLPTLIDARSRLLKPDGVLIPRRDILYACVVQAPDLYRIFSEPWDGKLYDLDLSYARNLAINQWISGRVNADQMLTGEGVWSVLEYQDLEIPSCQGSLVQKIVRSGVAHGLLIWFDTELMDEIGFSNSPKSEEPAKVYGSGFFPFLHPVDVFEGDEARIEIKAIFTNNDYTWCWDTKITSSGNFTKANFEQSTFYGSVISIDKLRKRQPGFVPKLNSSGLIESFIQKEMNGVNSVADIAKKLYNHFPGEISSLQEALKWVGDLSERYAG